MYKSNKDSTDNNFDEIDLKSFFEIFIRNKYFVLSFAFFGFIFSCVYALLLTPVWKGSFEMLMGRDDQSDSSSISKLKSISNLDFGGFLPTGKNNIETQLTVVRSPLVLKSVFEFVKENREKNNNDDLSNYRFELWREDHVSVYVKEDTNVLTFSYSDKDKKEIRSVMDLVVKNYQNFSIADNKREFVNQISFLKEQIEIHKLKTKNSYNSLDKYALENNLTIDENYQLTQESLQLKNRDEIYKIRQLLDTFDKSIDNSKIFLVSLPRENTLVDNFNSQFGRINELNPKISLLESQFKKESYPPLQNLIAQRDILIKNLNEEIFEFLQNRLVQLENNLNKDSKDNLKIIKFKELLRESNRNEKTLAMLENIFQERTIEQSKYLEPWILISDPQILPRPIFPNKRSKVLYGTIFSILAGCAISIFRENRSGTLFSRYNIIKYFPYKFLKELNIEDQDSIRQFLGNIKFRFNKSSEKNPKVSFLLIGSITDEINKKLNQSFNLNSEKGVYICSDLYSIKYESKVIVIVKKGAITKFQIDDFIENIKITDKEIEGFILLS